MRHRRALPLRKPQAITKIAISSTSPSPLIESRNACAVPWNASVMVAGIVSVATVWIGLTASPGAKPGARLNETSPTAVVGCFGHPKSASQFLKNLRIVPSKR